MKKIDLRHYFNNQVSCQQYSAHSQLLTVDCGLFNYGLITAI
jgi:hypothetical protein